MSAPAKTKIKFFVSYAHDDHKKKEEFLKALETRMRNSKHFSYELWTDRKLLSGEDWRDEIGVALGDCEVGLLLVSQSFLASRFIVEEELPTFVVGEKPCIPVGLLPVNYGNIDMKGLEAVQVYRWQHPKNGDFKEFSACRGDAKTHFVDQLVVQIETRLKKLPTRGSGKAKPGESAQRPKSTHSPPGVERKMRKIFGPQFDAIRKIVESNHALRVLLTDTFITDDKGLSHDAITYRLMYRFYDDFCVSLGEMDALYRNSSNRDALLGVLSSIIFLAMSPDFAEKLRSGDRKRPKNIPEEAKQGVVALMKAWIQGENSMPLRELAVQQNHEMWECVPGDERNEILGQIMKRTPGVDPDRPGAEERFRRITRAHANRKTFIHAVVTRGQLDLIDSDLVEGGMLENMLIFAKAEGETIFQERGKGYDADFETQLDLLLDTLNKHN